MGSDPFWAVSVSSLFLPVKLLVLTQPCGGQTPAVSPRTQSTRVEQGLETRSPKEKESFIFLPLVPAAPLVFSDYKLLLLP